MPTKEVSKKPTPKKFEIPTKQTPKFIHGDALDVLRQLPAASIDCCMTSPPYFGQRDYEVDGIGLESTPAEFIEKLLAVFAEVRRVLKPSGSFWLNLGDSYRKKQLLGVPWRTAIAMCDQQDWILRNSVVWHKVKGGMDNTKDKLRNVHEDVFHFVKSPKYYYDHEAIRTSPRQARVTNGAVVSATGVSGVRYRRQIELSTVLTDMEKTAAEAALNDILNDVREGRLSDFRMIIRGQQRVTHSDSSTVSGRAREIQEKGFYFLKYHPKGTKPSDVWDILPEDTQKRKQHFASYPVELCSIPILATSPEDGVVLDPFAGTGTTCLAAFQLQRRSIGIDLSEEYLDVAKKRCTLLI